MLSAGGVPPPSDPPLLATAHRTGVASATARSRSKVDLKAFTESFYKRCDRLNVCLVSIADERASSSRGKDSLRRYVERKRFAVAC